MYVFIQYDLCEMIIQNYYFIESNSFLPQFWKSHYQDYRDYLSCLADCETRVPEA